MSSDGGPRGKPSVPALLISRARVTLMHSHLTQLAGTWSEVAAE